MSDEPIKRITVDLLRQYGATEERVEIFAKRWPNGVAAEEQKRPVVPGLGIDVKFAAEYLLDDDRSRMAYFRATRPAWTAYLEAAKQPDQDFLTALRDARVEIADPKELKRALAAAVDTHHEALAPLYWSYREAMVRAFVDAWTRIQKIVTQDACNHGHCLSDSYQGGTNDLRDPARNARA